MSQVSSNLSIFHLCYFLYPCHPHRPFNPCIYINDLSFRSQKLQIKPWSFLRNITERALSQPKNNTVSKIPGYFATDDDLLRLAFSGVNFFFYHSHGCHCCCHLCCWRTRRNNRATPEQPQSGSSKDKRAEDGACGLKWRAKLHWPHELFSLDSQTIYINLTMQSKVGICWEQWQSLKSWLGLSSFYCRRWKKSSLTFILSGVQCWQRNSLRYL